MRPKTNFAISAVVLTLIAATARSQTGTASPPPVPVAWGNNGGGQLGFENPTSSLTPQEVVGLGAGSLVTSVGTSQGTFHSVALKSNGSMMAWGINDNGQLGDGTTTTRLVPVQVSGLGPGSGVTAIAAGANHTLASVSYTHLTLPTILRV